MTMFCPLASDAGPVLGATVTVMSRFSSVCFRIISPSSRLLGLSTTSSALRPTSGSTPVVPAAPRRARASGRPTASGDTRRARAPGRAAASRPRPVVPAAPVVPPRPAAPVVPALPVVPAPPVVPAAPLGAGGACRARRARSNRPPRSSLLRRWCRPTRSSAAPVPAPRRPPDRRRFPCDPPDVRRAGDHRQGKRQAEPEPGTSRGSRHTRHGRRSVRRPFPRVSTVRRRCGRRRRRSETLQ